MTRALTAAVETEVQGDARAAILVHFAFDSVDLRIWSGIGDFLWNGDTYTGVGTLGTVSAVKESSSVRADGRELRLSGIDSSLLAIAIGEHYQGRLVRSWIAFFDADWQLINDPVQDFGGRIDNMVVSDSGDTGDIVIQAENRLVDLERPLEVRFYTDQDQQQRFAGDKGFEFVAGLQEKPIFWGRAKLPPPVSLFDDVGEEAEAGTPGNRSVPYDVPNSERGTGIVITPDGLLDIGGVKVDPSKGEDI